MTSQITLSNTSARTIGVVSAALDASCENEGKGIFLAIVFGSVFECFRDSQKALSHEDSPFLEIGLQPLSY